MRGVNFKRGVAIRDAVQPSFLVDSGCEDHMLLKCAYEDRKEKETGPQLVPTRHRAVATQNSSPEHKINRLERDSK